VADAAAFTANLLTAFVGLMAEQLTETAQQTVGSQGEAANALIALRHEQGMSVRRLSRVLAVAQPSAVAIVDQLVRRGLAEKRPGPDARTSALYLTAAGRRRSARLLQNRAAIAADALSVLDSDTTRSVHGALDAMIRHMTADRTAGDHICRNCNESACPDDRCPVEAALAGNSPVQLHR
jgi:MarR family transcriptional regulator, negative regulator of the multidrug operon emrRAB